jgi:hypothetical protein
MNKLKTLELALYLNRLKFLEQKLVSEALIFEKKNPTSIPPDEITDFVKSYIVLVYGETEEFVETLSLAHFDHIIKHLELLQNKFLSGNKINKANKKIFSQVLGPLVNNDSKKSQMLMSILSNETKSNYEACKKLLASLISNLKSMRKDVFYNNGLNAKDLEKLFDRSGFDTINRFIDLRNDLNILTFKRCRFAHTGIRNAASEIQSNMPDAIAVTYLPTAREETKKINQIARQLTDLVTELISLPTVDLS